VSKIQKPEDDEESRWPLMGVKMPRELKEKIQLVAEMDGRTMSGWARHVLEKAAETIIEASNKNEP
jgi:hypothetical protein